MKKIVYIHIGLHKTGSTAIQHFLHGNREALERAGIGVSQVGNTPTAGNARLADEIRDMKTDTHVSEMQEEISTGALGSLVYSSENFSILRLPQLEFLSELLAEHSVKILVFLRRQDKWLESVYRQTIKIRQRRETRDIDAIPEWQRLNYLRLLDPWIATFGKDAVAVQNYDAVCKSESGLQLALSEVLGLRASGMDLASPPRSNPSLSYPVAKVLRSLNRCDVDIDNRPQLIRFLADSLNGKNSGEAAFLRGESLNRLLTLCEAHNQALHEAFPKMVPICLPDKSTRIEKPVPELENLLVETFLAFWEKH